MEQAAALYRGPFLDGLAPDDLPEFGIGLAAGREALRQRTVELVQRIAAHHEERGVLLRALSKAWAHPIEHECPKRRREALRKQDGHESFETACRCRRCRYPPRSRSTRCSTASSSAANAIEPRARGRSRSTDR